MDIDQESAKSLARAAEHLFDLGRVDSAFELLRQVPPALLTVNQLRKLKTHGEEKNDLDLVITASRYLIVKLKGKKTDQEKKEYSSLIGSDWGALAMLHNLPKVVDQVDSATSNKLMYVLHHSLPYFSNGYSTRAQGVILGMKASGLDIVSITRPGFPLDIRRDLSEAEAVDVINTVDYRRIPDPKWTGPGRSRNYISDAADEIEKQIRVIKPKAVMAASNYISALPALIAARRCGLPFAYEVRGFWELTKLSRDPSIAESLDHKLKIRIDAKLAEVADKVFTLSNSMKSELMRRNVAEKKIDLIQNCCDPAVFKPRERDLSLLDKCGLPRDVPIIGYIGSFVDYEGLDDLTHACSLLRKQGHSFRLLIVGASEGAVYEKLRKIAQQQGLDDWLVMPGRVPHDQVDAWYSLIDITPFPRKSVLITELVTPLKPLEAMSMEKAVVMSSVSAMTEMVEDGVTGLLFDKSDMASLAKALAKLITDEKLRSELGKNARKYVESERTWTKTCSKVSDWMMSL